MGSDLQKCQADRALLLDALAGLLRQTANPDPLHPAFRDARAKAADAYRQVSA